jgi:branched-subunit amino acid aminotransferase/4-amino-4-deoxychorismate lyase
MAIMYVEIDGQPPTVEALQHRAFVNYGNFTSLQVRDRSVRGLDLHLRRLSSATRELFDVDLDHHQVRRRMGAALDRSGGRSCSMRVDVFQPPGADDVSIMVSLRSPVEPAATPQRLQSVVFRRPLAHIKHMGTFAQIYYGRRAEHRGFDEALFVGSDGAIYEGSIRTSASSTPTRLSGPRGRGWRVSRNNCWTPICRPLGCLPSPAPYGWVT